MTDCFIPMLTTKLLMAFIVWTLFWVTFAYFYGLQLGKHIERDKLKQYIYNEFHVKE